MDHNPQIDLVPSLFNLTDGSEFARGRPVLSVELLNRNKNSSRPDWATAPSNTGRFWRQCTWNPSHTSVVAPVEGQMAAPARPRR